MYFKRVQEKGEEPDPNLRELEVMKANYGPIGETIQVLWQSGVFVPLEGEGGMYSVDRTFTELKIEERFLQLLNRFIEQNRTVSERPTANNYGPTLFAGVPPEGAAKRSKRDYEKAMERLFAKRKLKVEVYGRPANPHTKLVPA
jgi:RecA-family ATPase